MPSFDFLKITKENLYDYENIIFSLSQLGLRYMLPYILEYLLVEDDDFSSNLSDTFAFLVNEGEFGLEKFTFVQELEPAEKKLILDSLEALKTKLVKLGFLNIEIAPISRWEEVISGKYFRKIAKSD